MNVLIIYHMRLGDIARCLPIAKHYADQGHDVIFECLPEYHGLFDMVPYCKPCHPGADRRAFDLVFDLQIWPARNAEFLASGKNWMDFIYDPLPEKINRQIVLQPPAIVVPPELSDALLVFPTGYSQQWPIDPRRVVEYAQTLFPNMPHAYIGKRDHGMIELPSIADLCAWIHYAGQVLTINSSPSILASALRDNWYHIPDHPQHDWVHPKQFRVRRPI